MDSESKDELSQTDTIGTVAIPPATGVFAEPWSVRKLLGMMAVFGPAAIVASMAIGAGETIVVVRAGSWAGYDLLWLVLLSCVVKGVFLTYLLGRYTAISGEYIGHRLVRLPGPRGWFLITIVVLEMLIAPLVWAAIAKPCGDLLHYLLQDVLPMSVAEPVWENYLTTSFVALACLLGLALSFHRLEKQQICICGILVVGTITGTLMVCPDFWQAFVGSVSVGKLPSSLPEWTPDDARQNPLLTMATTFGYVGGTIMGYLVYANWIGLHGWGLTGHKRIASIREHAFTHDRIDYLPDDPQQVKRLRKLIAPLRWDVGMGAIVLFIVTGAFMMSGAAVLYPMLEQGRMDAGFQGWSLLTEQAHVWRNIHPGLVAVYYVCVIAALWGTLQALPEAYARVTQEFFQAVWPGRTWDYAKIRAVICVYLFVFTTVVVWTGASFDTLIQIASFLVSNFALAMIMFAALYLNSKLPPAYRTRLPVLLGGVISAIVLSVFTAISGWGLTVKLTTTWLGGQ
ncbi:MAG: Nramp family divalent metal transporter [Pirellulaceae bacterium]|nr:Nramp family divalent metal transporter [Pirellulaceae bacterium]